MKKMAYIGLPLVAFNAARLGIPEGIASTVQVDLPRSLLVARHYGKKIRLRRDANLLSHTGDDGHSRAVLGDQACGLTACRENKDGTGPLLRRSRNSGDGYGFSGFRGTRLNASDVIE